MAAELTGADIAAAAAVLDGVAHRTPALTSSTLDTACGATVFCKAENFQRTGTFKFRGAFNALSAIPAAERTRGVCTVSSGNHAQAVALAAKLLGVPAVVLMPEDAPSIKRAAVEGYGAEVVTFDRYAISQSEAGEQLRRERGLPFVSSHDDPLISAGAGTAMLELLDDAGPVDVLVAPVGGGGGISGYATALLGRFPVARVIAVEPAVSGLLAASLAAGERVERPVPDTIADGMRLRRIGALPFEVLRRVVHQVVGVTEQQIVDAMRFAYERMKIVVEPSGAASLAAVLSRPDLVSGRRVGVIISGGNIDAATFGALTGVRG